jgi:hypothetical protein
MFPITMDDGTVVEKRADFIRTAIDSGYRSDNHCPVCNKFVESGGRGPHTASHLRQLGDIPPRKLKARKPKVDPKPKAPRTPPVEDACLALIHAYAKTVPVSMIGDINAWVENTKTLIGALK